jgi:hypothetical protein
MSVTTTKRLLKLSKAILAKQVPVEKRESIWEPLPYMLDAVRFMVQRPAAGLFLDPGFAKTAITLHAFLIRLKAKRAKKMLVVAKLRICELTWPEEIEKWNLPLRHCLLHGSKKQQLLESDDYDVYLINYEGLEWLSKQPKKLLQKFEMFVADESSKLKETRTLRFKSLKKILGYFKFRHILTGSPLPKSLMDIFGQVFALDMGETFSPYITHFRNEYMYPSGFMGYDWQPKPDAEERIFKKLENLVLRLPPDLIKLPPISIIDRPIHLPRTARKRYDLLESAFKIVWASGQVTAANAAVAAGKLRQMAGGAVYDEDGNARVIHHEKIEELAELRDELGGGEPMFVAYEYQHELLRLQERFPDGETFAGMNKAQAIDLRDRFNAGKVPMLFGQPQAVAHGLNLQATARIVVWMTLTWDLESYEQFIQRIWRQGQKRHVHVYRIIAQETVDHAVVKALDIKDKRQQRMLIALEARYGEAKAKSQKDKRGKPAAKENHSRFAASV